MGAICSTGHGRMFSRTLEHRRKFHQLGMVVAATLFVVGVALIATSTIRGLNMFQVVEAKRAPVFAGMFIALVALSLLCLASYYIVRAIGWFRSR